MRSGSAGDPIPPLSNMDVCKKALPAVINESAELLRIFPVAALTVRAPAVFILLRVMLPTCPIVPNSITILPLPALRAVPGAIVTEPGPDSRYFGSALLELARSAISPLLPEVSMSALMLMLRPAISSKLVIEDVFMGWLTVMSL